VDETPLQSCGWCQEPAVTEVIVRPGRSKRKTTPVCETHAKDFEQRGIKTTRVELDEKLERDRKRGTWRAQHQPWR
jgi:hypothetical protein